MAPRLAFFASAIVASLAALIAMCGADEPQAGSPDYTLAANWVCRPGAESPCTTGLDATVVDARGWAKPLAFAPASDPPIDCFYVYPTISKEQGDYSDLQASPEILSVANMQVGRLSSRCRVYAPLYRQETIAGLRRRLVGRSSDVANPAPGDVAAAWSSYLAHDNHGRGVVLIGHSQGTIVLQQLIATTIDGTSQQKLLISAFLAGDPSLAVPTGKTVGGTFAHVPLCSSAAQTGCVYVWGSYADDDDSPYHFFGAPLANGMTSACVAPSAPAGGSASLKFFHVKPEGAPASDPPWIESLGGLTGECRNGPAGNGFVVSVAPGPGASDLTALLHRSEIARGWGLHLLDVGLVQGNILDVLDMEIATWTATHRGPVPGAASR